MKKVLSAYLVATMVFSPLIAAAEVETAADAPSVESAPETESAPADAPKEDVGADVSDEGDSAPADEPAAEEGSAQADDSGDATVQEEADVDAPATDEAAEVTEETAGEGATGEVAGAQTDADDQSADEGDAPTTVDPVGDLVERVEGDLVTPIVDPAPADEAPSKVTRFENVELGVAYAYEGNDQVQVTFTALPENPGSLSIEEVTLTADQAEALGAASRTAYDITSDMEDGTFAYDLKLPVPAGEEVSQVVYAESVDELVDDAAAVSADQVEVVSDEDAVVVTELDHFTVFVVTSFEEVQVTEPEVGYNGIWFTSGDSGDELAKVPSGTDGIDSSVGNYHGKMTGTAFTRWDGYKNDFPSGGYETRVDVYVDTSLATGGADKRFDFSSAISTPAGAHRRDFIFSLGTNPSADGEWVASASNNAPGWPANPDRSPVAITESGWYTLEHSFQDVGGVLQVTMNLYEKGNSTPIGTWVLSDSSDVIGLTVGGNRYGWFVDSDFDWLAIDQAEIEYGSLDANDHDVVVTPSAMNGWSESTTGAGDVAFVEVADAPLGDGALNLTTEADNNDRASISRSEDVRLADVTALGYSTYRGAGFIDEGNAAYRVSIDADGDSSTTEDRGSLVFEPYWQNDGLGDPTPNAQGEWQKWDVLGGVFWASISGGNAISGMSNGAGGPPFYSIDDVLALHPDAMVTGISVGVGSYNQNYDVLVDEVVFGYETGSAIETYTYDLEPAPVVGTLGIVAYQCLSGTTVTRAENGVGGAVPEDCWLDEGANFGYTHGSQTDANAPYPELAGPITEAGATDVNGELSLELEADGRYLVVETDGSGSKLPAEQVLGFYCVGDGDTSGTNDNQELTFVPADGSVQCVAFNPAPADTVAPSAPTLLSPADGTTLGTNEFDFTWNPSTDDQPGAITYQFQSSLDGAETDGVLTNGLWTSGTLTSPTIHSTGAPDGAWHWQVRAQDAAGNWSDWSEIWTVTLDTTPNVAPAVTIVTPADGAYVRGTVIGRATSTDDEGMGSYYLRFWKGAFESGAENLVGNCQEAPGADLLGTSLDKSCAYTTTANPDGVYVFSAQFLDSDNAWGQALRTFTVDNTKPVTVLESPTTTYAFKSSAVGFTLSATDNIALKSITGNIYQGSTLVKSNSKTVAGVSTADTFTFTVSSLAEGSYTIRFNSSDKAGNISSTQNVAFTVDDTRPIVTLTAPTTTSSFKVGAAASFTVDATDDVGLSKITGNIYQGSTLVKSNSKNVAGATTTDSFSFSVSTLPEGAYTLRYNALDTAGNVASTKTFDFTVDGTRPVVTLVNPDASTTVFAATEVDFAIDATDDVGLNRITGNIYQGAALFKSNTTAVPGGATVGSFVIDLSTLPDGAYTLRYNASDTAGNIAVTKTFDFTIDSTPDEGSGDGDGSGDGSGDDGSGDGSGDDGSGIGDGSGDETSATGDEDDDDSGARRGSRSGASNDDEGVVFGASTDDATCEPYLSTYMRQGGANDPAQVSLLQSFLTGQGYQVPVTGYYGPITTGAVVSFQIAHADEVLKPWGIGPTGIVYKTTRWKINDIVCPGSEAFPEIQ
jgi:hypothetical protein